MIKVAEFRSPDGVRRGEVWALDQGYRVILYENSRQVHTVDLTSVLQKAEHIAEEYVYNKTTPEVLFG